jgi:signal transduction histidine kinase/two-component SAPR family response regulator
MSEAIIHTNFKARILVVDDHPGTAATLARAISQMGTDIEVLSATSGMDALEKVEGGSVDVLITDLMMPKMNGLELIERLQAHPAGRPTYVILITAYDVPGLKETARRLKVNETMVKPVRPEHICRVIGKMLETTGRVSGSASVGESHLFKILVADDSPDNLTLMSRYMQDEGYSFITASNGVETLEKIRSEMPDLVLLDVNMPVKDGFTVLAEMRDDPAIGHIPVIMFTAARLNPKDVQEGLNLGADDYIVKPFDRRELFARIRSKLRVKESEDIIRKRNRELSVLPEIGKELSARLDLNELLSIILRRSVETLGAFGGRVLIINQNGVPFQKSFYASDILPLADSQFPRLDAILKHIEETHQGLIISDVSKDSKWQMLPGDPTRSVLISPLFGRNDLLGLLILAHEQMDYFQLDHLILLQAIASQAAIAVENAQLYSSVAKERQKLAAVLQSAADAILMFNTEANLSLLNPAAEKLFTDYEAKLGLPLEHGRGYDSFIELLDQALASRRPITGEFTWPDQRTFTALFTPIEEGGCVALLHDISHFKALERVKNEFISTATHDLKSPIGIIAGFSDLLAKAGPLNEAQMGFVEHIQAAAANMNELVQNLLELAKIDMGMELKQETLDMNGFVSDMLDEFQSQAEAKEQKLLLEKTAGRPMVRGDALQLKQALRNLVGNAIKYTPVNGSINISLEKNEEAVIIHIKDNGYGIPAGDLPFIFDRFYRANDERIKNIEGNGLGLAITKSITERHNGRVNVKSEPGKGSCFTIMLPLAQQ